MDITSQLLKNQWEIYRNHKQCKNVKKKLVENMWDHKLYYNIKMTINKVNYVKNL